MFDRNKRGKDAAQKVLGVGHKLMDLAMVQARGQTATVAALPPSALANPIYICHVRDRVTAKGGFARSIIAARRGRWCFRLRVATRLGASPAIQSRDST